MTRRLWLYFLHLLAGVAIGWWIFACAPIKRHDRIVRKYPFVHTERVDTIRDTIRVTIPEVRVDTFFHVDRLYDTITIREEHLTAKVFRVRDSVFLVAQCDTIFRERIIEREVPVTIYDDRSKVWEWIKLVLIIPIVLIILYVLIRLAVKWIQQSFL